jgi:hypothetical protein
MTRIQSLILILTAASAMCFAQTESNSGWRRVGDPAPAQPQAQSPAQAQPTQENGDWHRFNTPQDGSVLDQDPTQPVARTDEYGQPVAGQPQQPQAPVQQRADRPAPPPYGLPPHLTIPAGTFVTIRMNQALSSDRNQEGDIFTAILTQPVVVDGVVVAQRGQTVMGRVAEATKAGRAQGVSRLALQLTGLTLADGSQVNVQSQMVNRNGRTDVGRDVSTVATTTAVGAAVGAAADWGRGAAIGAGAGAAAGIIGVLLTRGHETIVYPESVLTFQINTPVAVNTARAPQAFRYVGPDEYDHPVQAQVERRPPPRRDPYYSGPYAYPYPYPYPYYSYPYYWGGGFGVGVVIRGGHGRRW